MQAAIVGATSYRWSIRFHDPVPRYSVSILVLEYKTVPGVVVELNRCLTLHSVVLNICRPSSSSVPTMLICISKMNGKMGVMR